MMGHDQIKCDPNPELVKELQELNNDASVTQRTECLPSKQVVAGSNPARGSKQEEDIMSKDTYSSGQTPQVGDVVKVAVSHQFGYNSMMPYASRDNSQFEVTEVLPGQASTLIKIKQVTRGNRNYDCVNAMKASNFTRLQASDIQASSGKPKSFVITNAKSGQVVKHATAEELTSKLEDLLLANPRAEYNVYKYENTAKVSRPTIEFEVK